MLDVSVAYNRYKFLGHEFLTWLWFMIETDKQTLMNADRELEDIYIGNRIVLENSSHNRDEIITIKGDGAGLEEGVIALQSGDTPRNVRTRLVGFVAPHRRFQEL